MHQQVMLENLWVPGQICYKQELARDKNVEFEFLITKVEWIPAIWDSGNPMNCYSELMKKCTCPKSQKYYVWMKAQHC